MLDLKHENEAVAFVNRFFGLLFYHSYGYDLPALLNGNSNLLNSFIFCSVFVDISCFLFLCTDTFCNTLFLISK